MKKTLNLIYLKVLFLILLSIKGIVVVAQESSAILDLESTNQGLLIPRMTSAERSLIQSPQEALLVYDLDTGSFWYYHDGKWWDLNLVNRAFINSGGVVASNGDHAGDDFVFGSPQLESDGNLSHNSRMFFDKSKRAFRVGSPRDTSVGFSLGQLDTFVFGDEKNWDPDSLGYYSFASGYGTKATGDYGSAAIGYQTIASGHDGAVALGRFSEASGDRGAIAMGSASKAIGSSSIAMGNSSTASGTSSIAGGFSSRSDGNNGSFALGNRVLVTGNQGSIGAGYQADCSGDNGSLALGFRVNTIGSNGAVSMGSRTSAAAEGSMVIGSGFYDDIDREEYLLTNNIANSLMVGFKSTLPTLFVGPSSGSLSSTGKVGIGTANPLGTLHVKANDFLSGTRIMQVLESGSGNPTLLFSRGGGTLSTGMSIEYNRLGPDPNHRLYFNGFDGNPLMTLHSNGKLGLGTTSPGSAIASAKLDVEGGHVVVSNNYGFFSENTAGNGIGAGFDTDAMDNLLLFSGGGNKLSILHDGNVGIGTSNPEHPIHVDKPGTAGQSTIAMVLESHASKRPTLLFSENDTNLDLDDGMSLEYDGAISGNKFYVNGVGGIPRLTVEDFGNIGIGTVTPKELLEISKAGDSRLRITSTDNTTAAIDLVRSSPNNTDWRIENGGNLKIFSSNDIDGGITERYSFGTSIFRPSVDNAHQLGATAFRWTTIHAVNGTIQTSDRRMKQNILPLTYGLSTINRRDEGRYRGVTD